jgi:hypothetical protein
MRFAALTCVAALCAASGAFAQVSFTDVTATHLPSSEGVTYATMDAVAIDIDHDGDLDLITPQEWRANRVLLNDGAGRFALATGFLPPTPDAELTRPEGMNADVPGKDSEDVSIGDFNGDGRLDIIMVVEDDVRLGRANVHQYYRALATGGYERVYEQLPDSVANAVSHADINGDGAPDILITGDAQDRLLINNGQGGFTDETEARLPREAAVGQDAAFFDADRDDDLDIVLGLEGGHALWINDGSGVFGDESKARLPPPGNVEARKVTPVDIDSDGDLDLYFSHVSWQGREAQDRLFINDGRGRFSDGTATWFPVDDQPTLDTAFADLDGDRDLDMVQANIGSVRVFLNEGQRFVDVSDAAIPGTIDGVNITVEVADFNADRRPDIFLGQLGSPTAHDRLLLNTRRRR